MVQNLTKELIKEIVSNYKRELIEKYGVKNLYLFGSYARNEYNDNSDIDFVVEFEDEFRKLPFRTVDLMLFLEKILQKEVEAGELEDLIPEIRDYVKAEMIKC